MNCGCGSMYTLTPGDRLYLSAMVKSLQRRVSVLEDTTIDLPQWVLQPNPPVYNVNQIIGAVASSDLADVAFSGDYNDLLNAPLPPVIPVQINTDWNATFGPAELLNKPSFGSAAFSSVGDFATALQGAKADSAIQSSDLGDMAYEIDAPSDGVEYVRKNGGWAINSSSGGGGSDILNFIGLVRPTGTSNNFAGYTVLTKLPGDGLIAKVSSWKFYLRLSRAVATPIGAMVVCEAVKNTTTVLTTTPITIGSNATPTLPATGAGVYTDFYVDPISLPLDSSKDYWILIYFAADGNPGPDLASTGVNFFGVTGGYSSGDLISGGPTLGYIGGIVYGTFGFSAA